MPATLGRRRRWRVSAGVLTLSMMAALSVGAAGALPPEVDRALQRARVPEGALVAVVQDAASGRTVLSLGARQPVNPASLAKLFTTAAAMIEDLSRASAERRLRDALVTYTHPHVLVARADHPLREAKRFDMHELRNEVFLVELARAHIARGQGFYAIEPARKVAALARAKEAGAQETVAVGNETIRPGMIGSGPDGSNRDLPVAVIALLIAFGICVLAGGTLAVSNLISRRG